MSTYVANFCLILAALAVIILCIILVVDFSRQPKEKQIEQLREWLLYACTMAEAQLGGGSGQLKLRLCYDWFLERFPWLAKVIDFDWFSELVDDALEQMRGMLETNSAIKAIVEGDAV